MAKRYNLARMTTATTGTGTLVLGTPVAGFISFAAAGAQNGDTLTYSIEDGNNREVGHGVYTASGHTLTRTVLMSTSGGAAINLSGSANVMITLAAEDIPSTFVTALSGLSDVNELVAPVTGQVLAYGAGGPPTVVQKITNAMSFNSPTLTLPSAPSVGNTLVLIVEGYSPVSCAGFAAAYASGVAYDSMCTVLTRTVISGDPAAWAITTNNASFPSQAILLEVSGAFTVGVTEFTPALSGNSYSQTITHNASALDMGFYSCRATGYMNATGVTGATELMAGSWTVASLVAVQYTTTGAVTITNSGAPGSLAQAFRVQLVGVAQWVPTDFATLMALYVSGGTSTTLSGTLALTTSSGAAFSQTAQGFCSTTAISSTVFGALSPATQAGQTIVGIFSVFDSQVFLVVSGAATTNWFTTVTIPGIGTLTLTAASVTTSGGCTLYSWAVSGTVSSGNVVFT